jgi:hypothetical protein
MQHLTELSRGLHGGRYDDTAINSHSVRTFSDAFGRTYLLSRELDQPARPYRAFGPIAKDYQGIMPAFAVSGAAEFGEDRSWKTAEKFLDDAVGEYNVALANIDEIVVFESNDKKRVISHGLSGTRVEVWNVPQDVIDRGTWGDKITSAGWCWQRMDSQEIYGSFETSLAALNDYSAFRREALTQESKHAPSL